MENLDPDQQEEGDLKEGYRIGNDLAPDHPLVRKEMPFHGPTSGRPATPEFRQAMEAYGPSTTWPARSPPRSRSLLELLEDYFAAWFTTPMVIMSPLHYPPQQVAGGGEISEARIGAGAHSDLRLPGPARPGRPGRAPGAQRGRPLDRRQPGAGHLRGQRGRHAGPLDQRPVPPDPAPGHQCLGPGPPVDPVQLRPQPRRPGRGHRNLPGRGRAAQVPPTTSIAHPSRSASAPPCPTWTRPWWTAGSEPADRLPGRDGQHR